MSNVDKDRLVQALGGRVEQLAAELDGEEEQLSLLALEPMLGEIKRGEKVMTGGRPKGSKNRRVTEIAAYILARHRNPVEAAAEVVDTPIPDLAVVLKCSLLDAGDFWRRCAEFVARYTLQAMPQQVNVTTPLAGYMTVINMAAPRAGEEAQSLSPYGLDLRPKAISLTIGNTVDDDDTDRQETPDKRKTN